MLYTIFYLIIRLLFSCRREYVITKQGSKYNSSILITECGSKRIMRFNNLSSGAQAEIDLNRLDYPSDEYIQLMIISLLYYPFSLSDKNLLIIGLGGGILPRAIRKVLPMCSIRIIEIDPLVEEMAKKYFYFKEDSKMKISIGDGRTSLNNLSDSTTYDVILLDVYDSISVMPFHMKTKEFFIETKNRLNRNGGLVIINLVSIYKSYLSICQTINSVFGEKKIIQFRSKNFVNVIIVASSFIQDFPIINQKSNIQNEIKDKLSINISSLIKKEQKQRSNHSLSTTIYTDNMMNNQNEEQISLTQFANII